MFKIFSSLRLTIFLLLLLIFSCVLGTVIIQSSTLSTAQIHNVKQFYIEEYGAFLGKIIPRFFLDRVFYSPWFIGLLTLFGLHLFFCTIRNFKLKFRRLGFLLTHTSILIVLIGIIIGSLYGDKGFIWIEEGKKIASYTSKKTGKTVHLPFEIYLKDFELEYYQDLRNIGLLSIKYKTYPAYTEKAAVSDSWKKILNSDIKYRITEYYPQFSFNIEKHTAYSVSDNPVNPAVKIEMKDRNDTETRYLISKFSDFAHNIKFKDISFKYDFNTHISNYISHLKIVSGKNVKKFSVKVNNPLSIAGYKLYQSSYDTKNLKFTGLEIVKDPGLPFVYLGFIFLTIGIFFIFYVKPLFKKSKPETID